MSEKRTYREASATEKIYIATSTIVVSRSSLVGTVSREQFEQAVSYLEARYGILRSAVEDGLFVERTDRLPPLQAWMAAESCSVEDMYARLLNAGLDTGARVYEIYVIAAEDALEVFMLTSHAITDATSLVELHSYLAYACDCVVQSSVPLVEEQPFPAPVDAAVEKSLADLPADRRSSVPSYAGDFAEIAMPAPYAGAPARHALDQLVIEADDVHRISAASHAQGSSVHSLLLAAFALAIREAAEARPRQILMRSSIDMRRRLEPHVSADLVFSAITGHISLVPDLDQPLFEIARLIFADVHAGVANGSIYLDYVNYPKTFGSPQQAPVALNVSDMQSVTFHWPMKSLKVAGFEYALGWLKRFPNVSVAVYDGKLTANTVYVEQFVSPATMRTVSQSVARMLIEAGRAQRSGEA